MTVDLLSRIQFALTIGFHYLFPPWSIGLSLYILFIEGRFIKTRDPKLLGMVQFWVKVFGLTFALGVATGFVQVFEFGTNWAAFSRYVGDVFGSALGAEGIFAFLLESGFLAILLFGWNRVGPKTHYFAAWMVALGSHFSAVWIVVANSWMQTPAGYKIVGEGLNAHAEITSFWEMIFNPSAVDRLVHVIIGCWLAGTFLVMSISAYYLLKKRHTYFAQVSMKLAVTFGCIFVVLQLWSADATARGVIHNQPAKLAAMEGLWETQANAPLYLVGYVDQKTETTKGIAIPGLLSFLSYHDTSAVVTGLDAIPKEDRPYAPAVFQFYHLMIAVWALMFLTTFLGWIFWKKIKVGKAKWLLWLMIVSVVFPVLGNEAGWFTAEMGRQPWIVYGLLRRSDALTEVIGTGHVLGSIIMFGIIYLMLFGLFTYLLDRKIKHGPEGTE